MKRVVLGMIAGYQVISRMILPRACRFYPTCSAYASEAIERFGLVQGVRKTFYRILRCHPWAEGGYDPVKE